MRALAGRGAFFIHRCTVLFSLDEALAGRAMAGLVGDGGFGR